MNHVYAEKQFAHLFCEQIVMPLKEVMAKEMVFRSTGTESEIQQVENEQRKYEDSPKYVTSWK